MVIAPYQKVSIIFISFENTKTWKKDIEPDFPSHKEKIRDYTGNYLWTRIEIEHLISFILLDSIWWCFLNNNNIIGLLAILHCHFIQFRVNFKMNLPSIIETGCRSNLTRWLKCMVCVCVLICRYCIFIARLVVCCCFFSLLNYCQSLRNRQHEPEKKNPIWLSISPIKPYNSSNEIKMRTHTFQIWRAITSFTSWKR